jgi:hypothetical protein
MQMTLALKNRLQTVPLSTLAQCSCSIESAGSNDHFPDAVPGLLKFEIQSQACARSNGFGLRGRAFPEPRHHSAPN